MNACLTFKIIHTFQEYAAPEKASQNVLTFKTTHLKTNRRDLERRAVSSCCCLCRYYYLMLRFLRFWSLVPSSSHTWSFALKSFKSASVEIQRQNVAIKNSRLLSLRFNKTTTYAKNNEGRGVELAWKKSFSKMFIQRREKRSPCIAAYSLSLGAGVMLSSNASLQVLRKEMHTHISVPIRGKIS